MVGGGAKAKTYCAVADCLNNDKNKLLSFHSFPKDPDLCSKWISLIGREDLLTKKIKHFRNAVRVCSVHFGESAFKVIKHINPDAVPTLYLPNQTQEVGSEDTANSIGTQFNGRTTLNKTKEGEPSCDKASSIYAHWAMLTQKIKDDEDKEKERSDPSASTAVDNQIPIIHVKPQKSNTASQGDSLGPVIETEPTSDRTRKRKHSVELEEVKFENRKLIIENKRMKKELEELRAMLKRIKTYGSKNV